MHQVCEVFNNLLPVIKIVCPSNSTCVVIPKGLSATVLHASQTLCTRARV